MRSLALHFSGPLTFGAGDKCLFLSPYADVACVYLWTVHTQDDGRYLIHYVGEASNFAKRQRQHLISVLGLDYGASILWRDKSSEAPVLALKRYRQLAPIIAEYLDIVTVFVAPLDGDRTFRRRVEGAIARNLRVNHDQGSALYPSDTRTGVGATSLGVRLEITSDESIAGLEPVLEILRSCRSTSGRASPVHWCLGRRLPQGVDTKLPAEAHDLGGYQ